MGATLTAQRNLERSRQMVRFLSQFQVLLMLMGLSLVWGVDGETDSFPYLQEQVEQLEQEVADLRRALSDKQQEQENAVLQVHLCCHCSSIGPNEGRARAASH